jgi:hypothetical protein
LIFSYDFVKQTHILQEIFNAGYFKDTVLVLTEEFITVGDDLIQVPLRYNFFI